MAIFDFDVSDMSNDRYVISVVPCVVYMGELADIFNYGIVEYGVAFIGMWVDGYMQRGIEEPAVIYGTRIC